jgi:hypothetical protein
MNGLRGMRPTYFRRGDKVEILCKDANNAEAKGNSKTYVHAPFCDPAQGVVHEYRKCIHNVADVCHALIFSSAQT